MRRSASQPCLASETVARSAGASSTGVLRSFDFDVPPARVVLAVSRAKVPPANAIDNNAMCSTAAYWNPAELDFRCGRENCVGVDDDLESSSQTMGLKFSIYKERDQGLGCRSPFGCRVELGLESGNDMEFIVEHPTIFPKDVDRMSDRLKNIIGPKSIMTFGQPNSMVDSRSTTVLGHKNCVSDKDSPWDAVTPYNAPKGKTGVVFVTSIQDKRKGLSEKTSFRLKILVCSQPKLEETGHPNHVFGPYQIFHPTSGASQRQQLEEAVVRDVCSAVKDATKIGAPFLGIVHQTMASHEEVKKLLEVHGANHVALGRYVVICSSVLRKKWLKKVEYDPNEDSISLKLNKRDLLNACGTYCQGLNGHFGYGKPPEEFGCRQHLGRTLNISVIFAGHAVKAYKPPQIVFEELVTEKDAIDALQRLIMTGSGKIALDTEFNTYHDRPGVKELGVITFSCGNVNILVQINRLEKRARDVLINFMSLFVKGSKADQFTGVKLSQNRCLIGFDLKHDCDALKQAGILNESDELNHESDFVMDLKMEYASFLPEFYVINNNKQQTALGLSDLARICLGLVMDKSQQCSGWRSLELDEKQKNYAVLDAFVTFRLGMLILENQS